MKRVFRQTSPLDLRLTLGMLQLGRLDPRVRLSRSVALRAGRTPQGPATLRLEVRGDEVSAEATGPGAEWALEKAPYLTGAFDDPGAFRPVHPVLTRLVKTLSGLRIGASCDVMDILVPTIIEQKVAGAEAKQSYARLVRRLGEPAPGGHDLVLGPDPAMLAELPYWEFHRFNIERRRADVVRRVCGLRHALAGTVDGTPEAARARLQSVPGVGAWTAARVTFMAMGDPDAVIVGDYHIPHVVAWALEGKARGTDEQMVRLLEPYRGQRGRAIRLLTLGADRAPRRAPRARLRSFSSY